jgi:hypothetical protein
MSTINRIKKISMTAIAVLLVNGLMAAPTRVTVRVKAKDAKFIGTGIGGASVLIKNNLTGQLLANGITTGSSGDTKLILQSSLVRGQRLTDEKTAKYEAIIDINEPTLVDIEVIAPLSRKGAAIKGSIQVWLIPGKDIVGEGIIIDLPGLILDILSPTSHQAIQLSTLNQNALELKISLTMLCGCAITKGGVWNSDEFEVKASLKKDGIETGVYNLKKLNENNLFSGVLKINETGSYELVVYAFNPKDGNSGVDKISFAIQ